MFPFAKEGDNQEDDQATPEQLQDKSKDQGKKLKEINLVASREKSSPVFINVNMLKEMKSSLLDLLQEFIDIFAWTYVPMPALDPQFPQAQH